MPSKVYKNGPGDYRYKGYNILNVNPGQWNIIDGSGECHDATNTKREAIELIDSWDEV